MERKDGGLMTTKKQQKELEAELSEWVFEGLANSWSTTEILERVTSDWKKVVGLPSTLRGFKDLAEWQGSVLALVGLGLGWEIAEQQRLRSAGIVLSSFAGAGEGSVLNMFGIEVAEDVLADKFTGRSELVRSVVKRGSGSTSAYGFETGTHSVIVG